MKYLLLLLLLPFNALAGGVTYSWVTPVLRADNVTPLLLNEIAKFNLYIREDIIDAPEFKITIHDNLATSYKFSSLAPGTYLVDMTTTDTDGRLSERSNQVITIIQNMSLPPVMTCQ